MENTHYSIQEKNSYKRFFLIYPNRISGEDLEERRAFLESRKRNGERFEQRIVSSTGW
jgi:hypothetical protein